MFFLWLSLDPLTSYISIHYSMKRVALACSQDLALFGFFPYKILFSQSQIINDPKMFLFMKKRLYGPFSLNGVQLPQG